MVPVRRSCSSVCTCSHQRDPPQGRQQGWQEGGAKASGGQVCGIIEVEIDGVTIRIGGGADAKTVAAVIRALKAGT